jgi:hypothetical protein
METGPIHNPGSSVGDPDPDPQDLHVFGPPGSVSQRYGSGPFPFLEKVLGGAFKIKF